MSTITVILLIAGIAGYLGLLAFVLALLTVARTSETAEQHPRVLAARAEPIRCLDDEVGDGQFTAGDVAFLEGLDQRAAREFCAAPHPWAALGGRSPSSVRGRAERNRP